MTLHLLPFKKTLNKAYQKVKPNRSDMERFKAALLRLLDCIDHEAAKQTTPSADTSALEAEVDRLVYGLYGLGEEVRVVEGV